MHFSGSFPGKFHEKVVLELEGEMAGARFQESMWAFVDFVGNLPVAESNEPRRHAGVDICDLGNRPEKIGGSSSFRRPSWLMSESVKCSAVS